MDSGTGLTEATKSDDAIYLASAIFLTERLAEQVVFSFWDTNLSAAAKREGLEPLRPR